MSLIRNRINSTEYNEKVAVELPFLFNIQFFTQYVVKQDIMTIFATQIEKKVRETRLYYKAI